MTTLRITYEADGRWTFAPPLSPETAGEYVRKEVADRLREMFAEAAERIAKQSDLLSRRAEK